MDNNRRYSDAAGTGSTLQSSSGMTLHTGWKRRARRAAGVAARGEPMVWLTGGCIALSVLMIIVLLTFITWNGIITFWPKPLLAVTTNDGKIVMGEPARSELYTSISKSGETQSSGVALLKRELYRTGNYDVTGQDFVWVAANEVKKNERPQWALVLERVAWQNAYGILEGIDEDGKITMDPQQAWERYLVLHHQLRTLADNADSIERNQIGNISHTIDQLRLELRTIELNSGQDSKDYLTKLEQNKKQTTALVAQLQLQRKEVDRIRKEANRARLIVRTSEGKVVPADRARPTESLFVWQIVRAYPANQLDLTGKMKVYFSRWWEYLTDEPREANMEGGVFPAIVGTVLLTMIMVIFVVPLGVIAAVYLREYARQGLLVSFVRISVNNLAGVPSIVFGVFGLGFFCYIVGGSIDSMFFAERLPDPTLGKSALIWASLTLALLTLPVVIVATEEALAAVPRSMREGSYACGASKWQTIQRIVLPRAMPGIMTGMILAIARGAGEVAPMMLVGAVKLAPELPINTRAPFFGLDHSFMHLGFHIYDLGFQSRNSEAAKSMVYTTTLLLITIVVVLNLAAMLLRSRLRKAYAGGQF